MSGRKSWELSLIALLVVLVAALIGLVPGFYSGFGNFLALTENFLPFGLVALGLSTVILTGGIDLSVGATAGLSAIVMAELWSGLHLSIWLSALIGIVSGAVLGMVNGLIITRLRIEPLIATLATSFIYGSLATALAGDNPPSGFPDSFNQLGAGAIADILPYQILLFAVLAILFSLVMSRSKFGRKIVMLGYNPDAARYSGVRVDRILVGAYVISGAMAALAGIVLSAYYSAVRADMGDVLLLSTITMVVLGGVSIFGGEGSIFGVVIAVLVLGFLRQGMLIAGFSDMLTTMLTGAILLAAIAIKNTLAGRGTGFALLLGRLTRRKPA
jgi:AI-2 transport system permease protein/rhamnose transport system permease protein